jgi:hypothetical protein
MSAIEPDAAARGPKIAIIVKRLGDLGLLVNAETGPEFVHQANPQN